MTTTSLSEIQFDHKQWFHDIDRWNFYLQSWQQQIQEMAREYRRLQKTVEQYTDDLEQFADEVAAHRHRLLADESSMIQHHAAAPLTEDLAKNHDSNAAKHGDLYKMHEHLQQMQCMLQGGLSLCRHELFRAGP